MKDRRPANHNRVPGLDVDLTVSVETHLRLAETKRRLGVTTNVEVLEEVLKGNVDGTGDRR